MTFYNRSLHDVKLHKTFYVINDGEHIIVLVWQLTSVMIFQLTYSNALILIPCTDESSGLDWPSRYKIIKGICCGLHYLHEECQTNASVIHLDLKPANILLDDNMEPKIADFGLSKFFDDQKVQTCATTIAGSQ